MIDLNQQISNVYIATQLIVVFSIFLFTIYFPIIDEKINIKLKEGEGVRAANKYAKSIKKTFWGRSIILILGNLLVLSLFLPLIKQVIVSLFQNWSYETYSYLIIFIFIFAIFVWSLIMAYNLFDKIKKLMKFSNWETVVYLVLNKKND